MAMGRPPALDEHLMTRRSTRRRPGAGPYRGSSTPVVQVSNVFVTNSWMNVRRSIAVRRSGS
jgi:hypothetical protein